MTPEPAPAPQVPEPTPVADGRPTYAQVMKLKVSGLRDLAEQLGIVEDDDWRKNDLRGAVLDALGYDGTTDDEAPF